MLLGNLLQQLAFGRTQTREPSVSKRAVCHHSQAMFLAPWSHGMFDGALLQVVQNLIACRTSLVGDRLYFPHVMYVEVTHAPRENHAFLFELLESLDRFLEGVVAAPVEQITIQPIGIETGE